MRLSWLVGIPFVASVVGIALIPVLRHRGMEGTGVFLIPGVLVVFVAAAVAASRGLEGTGVASVTLITAAAYTFAVLVLLVVAGMFLGAALNEN